MTTDDNKTFSNTKKQQQILKSFRMNSKKKKKLNSLTQWKRYLNITLEKKKEKQEIKHADKTQIQFKHPKSRQVIFHMSTSKSRQ